MSVSRQGHRAGWWYIIVQFSTQYQQIGQTSPDNQRQNKWCYGSLTRHRLSVSLSVINTRANYLVPTRPSTPTTNSSKEQTDCHCHRHCHCRCRSEMFGCIWWFILLVAAVTTGTTLARVIHSTHDYSHDTGISRRTSSEAPITITILSKDTFRSQSRSSPKRRWETNSRPPAPLYSDHSDHRPPGLVFWFIPPASPALHSFNYWPLPVMTHSWRALVIIISIKYLCWQIIFLL